MLKERPVEEVVAVGFDVTSEGTKDLLSCLCDAKGAVLRVPLVEEGVDVYTAEEDDSLAGANGYRGTKVLLLRCWWPLPT